MQAALARVVIGGLLASTLITLVFIPVVYVTANLIKDRVGESVAGLRKRYSGDPVHSSGSGN